MKRQFFILFLILPVFSWAQTSSTQKSLPLSSASPESVGMSAERLARIDKICEQAIANGDIPGAVVLVARKGKIVHHKAFGTADGEAKEPLRTDHIFRIASQTKAITATAVMMLWEEGHFRLDDPISRWIPAFKKPKVLKKFSYSDTTYTAVPAEREITIRHLLTHTSGIGYGFIDPDERFQMLFQKEGVREVSSITPLTTAENVKRIAQLPLHFNPGEKYLYSMGLDVLGHFIEIVSGMSFDEFLRTRLFEPLGMNDTYFYLPPEKADRLVALQAPAGKSWKASPIQGAFDPNYPLRGSKTICSGGAGLSSTARDYATFLQMYLNEGELNGTRFLSRTTIQSIMANQIGDLWGNGGSYYGLAFRVVTEKGQGKGGEGSMGTFSWGGAFNTQYFADPKEEIIGVILKQTRNAWGDKTGWQFKQLVGQAIDD
ncbi:MAG: beta-lactamase family protein [Saprospiraceae bacterium]|nr:beta-lactamase family protein [Saprospiraceae bacterium]